MHTHIYIYMYIYINARAMSGREVAQLEVKEKAGLDSASVTGAQPLLCFRSGPSRRALWRLYCTCSLLRDSSLLFIVIDP